MIYLDNAATCGFKPSAVTDAALYAIKFMNANPGRSGHESALKCRKAVFDCRKAVSELFDCSPERVVFTHNCTAALNAAVYGLYEKGGEVITSVTEHNAVLRPLYDLEDRAEITLTAIKPTLGGVSAQDVEKALTPNTKLVVLSAASNVTGAANDVYAVGELLAAKNIRYIVDGAQAGGHVELSVRNLRADALCLAGHKGLCAIQGVGLLLLGDKTVIRPFARGGTGSDTFNRDMPADLPERMEAGTLNLPAICSLSAAAPYVKTNLTYFGEQLTSLTEYLVSELDRRPFVRTYSLPNPYGIVSFAHAELPSQEVAARLSDEYGIAVRGGYHCAPEIHRFLGTEKFGLVRASASPFNTRKELKSLLYALDDMSFCRDF